MTGYAPFIGAALMVVAYALLVNRIIHIARPLRDSVIEIGERLLSSPRLNDEQRETICVAMEKSLSTSTAWFLSISLIPAMIMSRFAKLDDLSNLTPEERGTFNGFLGRATVATLLNSPIAFFICGLQILFIMVVTASAYVPLRIALRWAGRRHHHNGHGLPV